MKILIPHFEITSDSSFPDYYKLFHQMTEVTFNSVDYWLCEYTGAMDLETGADNYASYSAWVDTQPKVTGIRVITKRSFMQRFTQAERIAIRNSIEDIKLDRINQNVPNVARNHIDDVLIDVVADLDIASEKYGVDLDLQATTDGLNHFVTMSILAANRVSELLVDGTDGESI